MRKNIFLLGDFPSATQAYFLAPLFPKGLHTHWWNISFALHEYRLLEKVQSGDTVLVCRYLSWRLIGLLKQLQALEVELIYFMDDDLLDYRVLKGLPLMYAWRLWSKATVKKLWIAQLFSQLWVSSPILAAKYTSQFPHIQIKTLCPVAQENLLHQAHPTEKKNFSIVNIAYHATWSHKKEMQWLAPILAKIQKQFSSTQITIFGDQRAKPIFQNIPRLTLHQPLEWAEYLHYTQSQTVDIGLAPLLLTSFNFGRSPTKFFDYSRTQAVGIYSTGPVYERVVSHEVNGLLVENDPEKWFEKIALLIENEPMRKKMAQCAWQTVLENSASSTALYD